MGYRKVSGHDPGRNAPILWNSTASSPQGTDAVLVFCDPRRASVEKQRAEVRREY